MFHPLDMRCSFWAKYILRRGWIRRQRARLYFPPGCEAIRELLRNGDYEADLAGEIMRVFSKGGEGTYLDLGSHIGLLSLPVLRYRSARVISVEGSKMLCGLMEKTRANSPYQNRWDIVQAIVSDQRGSAVFHQHEGRDAVYSSLGLTGRTIDPGGDLNVETTTVDHLWGVWNRPVIRVVKLDLEGAELAALRGAATMILANRPTIFMEWEGRNVSSFGLTEADLLDWAEKNRYEIFRVPDGVPVLTPAGLKLAMEITETLRLQPAIP